MSASLDADPPYRSSDPLAPPVRGLATADTSPLPTQAYKGGNTVKRTRRLVPLAILATSLLVGAGARAADGDAEYGKRGLYLGFNGAYALDLLSTELAGALGVTIPAVNYDNSWGLNARIGYRAFSFLALEIEYEWMEGIGINLGPVPLATYKPHTLTGNVKLILPTWRVQPYLLVGAGIGSWSVEFVNPQLVANNRSGTGFGFRGGAGIDLYLTESLALNAEGTAVLNTEKFNLSNLGPPTQTSLYYFSFGAGLTYHF